MSTYSEREVGLRVDARRNRDAILTAARGAFASSGLETPFAEIAAAGGVGRATLLRRFPTREHLVRAVLEDELAELESLAADLRGRPNALMVLLRYSIDRVRASRGLLQILQDSGRFPGVRRMVQHRLLTMLEVPLESAREAGMVRSDLTSGDVVMVLLMLCSASTRPIPGQAGSADRAFTLALEGIARRSDAAASAHGSAL
jgi:AcrR family transcriptional regulator